VHGHSWPIETTCSTADPGFRAAVAAALRSRGELCVLYAWTHAGGTKDWFLIDRIDQFDEILRRAGRPNDRIDVYLGPQLTLRGAAGDPTLRKRALALLDERGELMLATRRPGGPELDDDLGTEDDVDVIEWLAKPPSNRQVVIGPHPSLTWNDPTAALVAYWPQPDGSITPEKGAY
jgi:hypothetical protein